MRPRGEGCFVLVLLQDFDAVEACCHIKGGSYAHFLGYSGPFAVPFCCVQFFHCRQSSCYCSWQGQRVTAHGGIAAIYHVNHSRRRSAEGAWNPCTSLCLGRESLLHSGDLRLS